MKLMTKRVLSGIFALVLLVTMVWVQPAEVWAKATNTSVKITKPEGKTLKLLEGKNYKMKVKVTGASDKVTYKSSNTKVATVSASGQIKAVKKGTAKITVTSKENKGAKATITVKVLKPVESVTITSPDTKILVLKKGKKYTLKTSVMPKNASSKKVTYISSKKNVVTVSAKGKVTAKKKGTAKITVKAADGSKKKTTLKVIVGTPVTSVALDKVSLQGKVGGSDSLKAMVSPSNASVKSVIFTSSDETITTVDNTGTVKFLKAGTATITAKAADGSNKNVSCTVTVTSNNQESQPTPGTGENQGGQTTPGTGEDQGGQPSPGTGEDQGGQTTPRTDDNQETQKPDDGTTDNDSVSGNTPGDDITGDNTPGDDTTGDNTPGDDTPGDDTTGDNTPGDNIPGDDTPGDDTTGDNTPGDDTTTPEEKGYQLVWEDHFEGTSLDTADWNYELHDPGWVNSELQEYTDSSDNIYIEDGKLVIRALKTQKDGADYYTSGKVTTQGKQDFKYGRFEVRAKVPKGQGLWPAFWMMPTSESLYGQWPKCGEIDIMEILGHEPNKTYGTIHYGDPHNESQGTYVLEEGTFADDYHVYACEWVPGEIRFYVDNKLIHTENEWYTKKEGFGEVAYPAPFDQPFYLQLNLAVGGTWPGNPDATTDFDNAKFVVDYVKAWQLESYDENVEKPQVVLRDADETGNYVVNGDFVQESLTDDSVWSFLTAEGGEGSAVIENETLHVETDVVGTQNYSVQIVQPEIPMEIGSKYRLSFDAKADEARTMIVDISAPKRSWIRYFADTTVNLTTEKQSYSFEFGMTDASDAYGRLEFNFGNQGSTAAVDISNVRLEKIGTVEISNEKTMLPDGNYVYNSEFQEGTKRLAYWEVTNNVEDAVVAVTNEDNIRELKIEVPTGVTSVEQITVAQDGLALAGGVDYLLSLDAYADSEKTIKVAAAGQVFDVVVGTECTNHKIKFTTPGMLTDTSVVLYLATEGRTYIDNVRITEDRMILNGDFSNGTTGFTPYVYDSYAVNGVTQTLADYWVDSIDEDYAMKYEIYNTGDQDWYIQLKQENVTLEKDKWYNISFKIKSTLDRTVRYAMQHDGNSDPVDAQDWTVYNGADIALTSEYQTFTKDFQMKSDTDTKTNFTISMGKITEQISEKHQICIDDIALTEIEAPVVEETPEGENLLINPNFADGMEGWKQNIYGGGAADVSVTNNAVIYDITSVGTADSEIQLIQEGFALENDATYVVSFKANSTKSRAIKSVVMSTDGSYTWYGGQDVIEIEAGETTQVEYTVTMSKDEPAAGLYVSMGKMTDEDTPASTITLTDFSVVKISGGTSTETPDDSTPEETVPSSENLIANGIDGFETNIYGGGAADVSTTDNAIVYDITNVGTADSEVQLIYKGLPLENGATYTVRFKASSTENRAIKSIVMSTDGNYTWYGGQDVINLVAGEITQVEYTVTMSADDPTAGLYISMGMMSGGDTPISTITLSDFEVVKK